MSEIALYDRSLTHGRVAAPTTLRARLPGVLDGYCAPTISEKQSHRRKAHPHPQARHVCDAENQGGRDVTDDNHEALKPPTADDTQPDGSEPNGRRSATHADIATRIDDALRQILQAFEEKLKYDASKQQTVDRLYAELQGHRANLVAQAARPFIFGMIHHHAVIAKLLAGVRTETPDRLSPARFLTLLESLQADVEEVLAENGVAAYRAEPFEPFDRARQTVVGKPMPTTEEQRAGTIAACLGPGFEHQGRILVKARVSAYKYEQSPADP